MSGITTHKQIVKLLLIDLLLFSVQAKERVKVFMERYDIVGGYNLTRLRRRLKINPLSTVTSNRKHLRYSPSKKRLKNTKSTFAGKTVHLARIKASATSRLVNSLSTVEQIKPVHTSPTNCKVLEHSMRFAQIPIFRDPFLANNIICYTHSMLFFHIDESCC